MPTTPTANTANTWTFPIDLHGGENSSGQDAEDAEAGLAASLEKIPGFLRVEKHSGAQRGIYLVHFAPDDRSRQAVEDAILASGYTLSQPTPDQEVAITGKPE